MSQPWFDRKLKGDVNEAVFERIMRDAGYHLWNTKVEDILAGQEYLPYSVYEQFPRALKRLPDYLAYDPDRQSVYCCDPKFRAEWVREGFCNKQFVDDLKVQVALCEPHPLHLVIFLAKPHPSAAHKDWASSTSGVFVLKLCEGELQYRARRKYETGGNPSWFSWDRAEWKFTSRLQDVFPRLQRQKQNQTILKGCRLVCAMGQAFGELAPPFRL